MAVEDEVAESTIKYRIRAQIVWYLETASSSARQRKYEEGLRVANAPGNVPNEIICQWEDWVRIDDLDWYSEPPFSCEEKAAIVRFHSVWNQVSKDIPTPQADTIDHLIGTPVWNRLEVAAVEALQVFMKRGLLLDEAGF